MKFKLSLVFVLCLSWFYQIADAAYYRDDFRHYRMKPSMISRHTLPYFDKIQVISSDTPITVRVIADSLYHDIRQTDQLNRHHAIHEYMEVHNQTLHIHPSNKGTEQPKTLSFEVRASDLHHITFDGPGRMVVERINSNHLNVEALRNPVIVITGPRIYNMNINISGSTRMTVRSIVGLHQLNEYDDATLDLYWVLSNDLIIRQQNRSRAKLAGVAKLLDVKNQDQSYLNAMYLRGKRSFVEMHDVAVADVWTRNTLNMLAYDQSRINYHSVSKQENEYMRSHGSILNYTEIGKHSGYWN